MSATWETPDDFSDRFVNTEAFEDGGLNAAIRARDAQIAARIRREMTTFDGGIGMLGACDVSTLLRDLEAK